MGPFTAANGLCDGSADAPAAHHGKSSVVHAWNSCGAHTSDTQERMGAEV